MSFGEHCACARNENVNILERLKRFIKKKTVMKYLVKTKRGLNIASSSIRRKI